mgnify:CR=1 FL=1
MKTLQIPPRQSGVTLIELMVGLAIGLLVVAVAMGALMVSRGISGTVSDASGIQQQGAYILRVVSQQLRQTGSLYLNPDPVGGNSTDVLSPVAFEIKADAVGSGNSFVQEESLTGAGTSVTTAFRRYPDNVFTVAGTEATASSPATFTPYTKCPSSLRTSATMGAARASAAAASCALAVTRTNISASPA